MSQSILKTMEYTLQLLSCHDMCCISLNFIDIHNVNFRLNEYLIMEKSHNKIEKGKYSKTSNAQIYLIHIYLELDKIFCIVNSIINAFKYSNIGYRIFETF